MTVRQFDIELVCPDHVHDQVAKRGLWVQELSLKQDDQDQDQES